MPSITVANPRIWRQLLVVIRKIKNIKIGKDFPKFIALFS